MGWWKSIPVQKGDVIFATCDAFFEKNTQNTNTGINWNAFLFLNPNYALNNGENMMTPNNNLVGIGILPTFANNNPQIPKAYLIAQFYDENNVPKKQIIKYVTSANYSWNTLGEIQEIALENGRVEIFVANESNTKVYFDDLGIYKSPTPIVQENHYYSFGMNLVGIEKEGTPNHRFQYNGKEKETSFGVNWLEYGMRDYDAQIGRWFAVDALAEKYMDFSGYHYSGNNPQKFVEIDGNEFTEPMKRKVKELREQNNSYISGINERLKDKNLSETDRKTYNSLLSAHNAVNQEINDLEKSGTWYDYKEVNMGYSSEKKSGATFYNAKSGAVDVVIPQDSHIGLFAHELKHAHQFEIGTTSLQVYGGSHKGGIKPTDWQAYDITDEREAYARQELFKRPAPPNWEKEYIGKERDILHKDSKGKITNRIPFPQTSSDVNSVYNSYGGKAQELYTITRMNNSNMASKFQGKVIVSPQLSKIYKPKK